MFLLLNETDTFSALRSPLSSSVSFQAGSWTVVEGCAFVILCECMWASQVALVVKNSPANAGDLRDTSSIHGWEGSLEGGHGNPLQYSCLESPMNRGAWWATVHGASDKTELT